VDWFILLLYTLVQFLFSDYLFRCAIPFPISLTQTKP